MDVLAEGAWQNIFKEKPPVFTKEEQRKWLSENTGVCLGSDAFSRLAIILKGQEKAVFPLLLSRAVPSEMIMLLIPAINIILQWRLQVLDYFIIDYVNNSMKLKYGY